MEQHEDCMAGVVCSELHGRGAVGRSARRAGVVWLGVIGALLAGESGTARAQDSHLTVRPKTMATGTQNPAAGEYALTVPGYLVSVAPQCVGAHRCPLFVALPGIGYGTRQMTDWIRPVTDKYGMILLTVDDGRYTPAVMDSALQETLKRFAVDPNKLGIMGRCASGAAGSRLGVENLDVFTRVASVSGEAPMSDADPTNTTAEFLIDRAFLEPPALNQAAKLRQGGHRVKVVLALRGHEHQAEDYDFVGHWLQESWAKPNLADRVAPAVVANPVPALTSDMMTKMTTFWTKFGREPDSVRATARRATLHEVLVPVGDEQLSAWITNMPALAAKSPSVAADLKAAGLTAQQHDAYRVALLSAQVMKMHKIVPSDTMSVLAKNVEFVNGHLDEFKTLRAAGIANPDEVDEVQATATVAHPKLAEAMGAMGIWRTP